MSREWGGPDPFTRDDVLAGAQAQVLHRAGCPLHFWLLGPADRPLLVFTHGATLDHRMFAAQLPVVVPQYRVLLWDVRGHGRSQPLGAPFAVPLVVEDLRALLDQLGADQVVLVGQSLGTYVAQEFVFRYPARVRALALVGGTCITLNRLTPWAAAALRLSPLLFALTPYAWLRWAFARAAARTPAVQQYVYAAAGQIPRRAFLAIWDGTVRCLHYEAGYRITQPVLLTHGAADRTGNIRQIAPRWAARDPQVRYVVIPEAGHCANQDNPAAFNRVLREFLQAYVPST